MYLCLLFKDNPRFLDISYGCRISSRWNTGYIKKLFRKAYTKENLMNSLGFIIIFGKFAAIMGPFLVGVFTQITGESNKGILSLLLLFALGGFFLRRVKAEELV